MASPALSDPVGYSCIEANASTATGPTAILAVAAVAPSARRWRPSQTQGRALEVLGHAIEYLVDTRMFLLDLSDSSTDQLAARLLMQASRNVFAECAEIIPIHHRFKLWIRARFKG